MSTKSYVFLIYVLLGVTTLIAFEQVRVNDFIETFDDGKYVVENSQVNGGFTTKSVIWAFTASHASNWHPLTWLSHMLDCEVFGLNPSWHHMVNLLWHIINTLLLFWLLKKMTKALWPSVFVAAAFALHPLHVESVAWVAERKDVLSGFFWMLTIAAYVRYVERQSIKRYLCVVLALSLGLMAKPMLVTLPFILLLLDYWPLQRVQWTSENKDKDLSPSSTTGIDYKKLISSRLIIEKIPLLIPVAVSSIITFIVQRSGGAMPTSQLLPVFYRIANVLTSYAGYIYKIFWPVKLAVMYPLSRELSIWPPIVLLVLISIFVVQRAKQRPWLVVGWLWYLGTLVPVIGLVQVGNQSMADRYMYLPAIGIFIIVVWYAAEFTAKFRCGKIRIGLLGAALVLVMILCTRNQVKYWKNDFTLYEHSLKVAEKSDMIHNNYGTILFETGQIDKAILHFKRALEINPNYVRARKNLGNVLFKAGKHEKGIEYLEQVLQEEPECPDTYYNLAQAYTKVEKINKAIENYNKAIELQPEREELQNGLALLFYQQGRFAEATEQWLKLLQMAPDQPDVLNNIAWIFSGVEDPNFKESEKAIQYSLQACRLTSYERADFLDTLGVAYASAGKFDKAIEIAESAIKLAESEGKKELADQIRDRLKLYKSNRSYIE